MAMKICKECGSEISRGAKACPKCGKDSRNFFVKHKFLTFLLIIILLAVIVSSSSKNNNTNLTSTSTGTTKTKYSVGESFTNDYIKITFVSNNENFTNYSQYAEINKDCKIIQATFEIENISNSDQTALYTDFNCYADGYACDAFYNVDDSGLSSGFNATLSSGKKTKGNVYFQVPKSAQNITIEYDTNFWTSENIEFIVK